MDSSSLILISMAFTLGIRHGFDLDHLATIDSITRTVSHHKILSRMVGVLFSLGHGLVVTFLSIIIGSGIMHSHVPQWLDKFGTWVSIIFLFLFGILNLWNVMQSQTKHLTLTFKSFFARKLIKKNNNPIMIILIGALFALSFDTFTQVALFSLSASVAGGWIFSGILGFIFMLGMMSSDGLNGWLVSVLLRRADKVSIMLSRLGSLAVAGFSLSIGIVNLIQAVQ